MRDEVVGTVLAGCRVEEVIGRGGMSVVYRGEHVHLGKKVALKILSPVLQQDEDFRERFLRESRTAASIEHQNIIPIYDAGEADGLLYIAMRYVDGVDLKRLIEREGPLSLARTTYLIEQIAAALDAAHAGGLVHRDVKPGNVLVADGTERVFLTDFGVVKHGSSTGLTRTGYFLGTIDYAAPEQIEGRPVDPRTDVYAVGCLLYECLTGTPPFQRGGEMAAIHAHLTQEPPAATAVRPELPPAVDTIIRTAMAKKQEDRYPSAGSLVRSLRAVAAADVPGASDETSLWPLAETTTPSEPLARLEPTAPPEPPAAEPPAPSAPTAEPALPSARQRAGADDPAPAAIPHRRRRPGRRGLLAGAAVVLLAAGGATAAITLGGTHTPSAGAGPSAFPDAIEQDLLLAHIPAGIRPSCVRMPPIANSVFLRSVRCSQGRGLGEVTYSRAHSTDALRSYFLANVKALHVAFPTEKACAASQPAADEWQRSGLTTHLEGRSTHAEGRIACMRGSANASIFWTDTATKIFAQASRPAASWPALYAWWRTVAGPEKELGMDMSSMSAPSTPFPDAIEQELLLDHIPPAIRPTCVRSATYDDSVFLRAIQCAAQPKGATVVYMYAHAGSAMLAYSNDQITAAGLNFPTRPTCSRTGVAADTWVRMDDIGHREKLSRAAGGRLLCYVAGSQAVMEWTDIDTGVYAHAAAPAAARAALYRWWATKAGPGALEMTAMGPAGSTGAAGSTQSGSMQGTMTTPTGEMATGTTK